MGAKVVASAHSRVARNSTNTQIWIFFVEFDPIDVLRMLRGNAPWRHTGHCGMEARTSTIEPETMDGTRFVEPDSRLLIGVGIVVAGSFDTRVTL